MAQQGLLAGIIGIMLLVIIATDVVLPTVNTAINSYTGSGAGATLLGVVPTLLVLVVIVAIVAYLGFMR